LNEDRHVLRVVDAEHEADEVGRMVERRSDLDES